MPFPYSLRSIAALLLLVPAACSYDIAERPTGGPVVAAVDNTAPTASPLRDVRWELRELDGQAAPAMEQTPYLLLDEDRARVEGRAGCNRFSGPYTAPAVGQLRLGPLATTRSACPDLAAEGNFLQALNKVQHYRISGNALSLYSADTLGPPLARFQAVAGNKK
ncbi:META domain-containing protein [Hymenobacter sp. BT683]|uniref:META domain-containing protein n=1 Tax=Hymenobacter jeongseonensis TaxID=2791027 RepID=A0ABS0IHM1_9BACT|nr:META domain-containing protein [Hymenobacter jeongseonensis]MBF9237672.1 META domain-containing protein [Hymenobacter jeongseonensis]